MPLYKDEAVVLRTHKLGEADRIITFLTRYHGQVRAVAKGVRKTSSKFGGRVEPFMAVEVQFYEGKTLDVINQVETISSYGREIASDYPSFTVANVIVETAERLTSELSSPQQYLLLVGALRALANRDREPSLILDSYLLRSLALAGWAPNFELCVGCQKPGPHAAFLLSAGGLVCSDCRVAGAAVLDPMTAEVLGGLLAGDWESVTAAPASARSAASGIVAAYSQWHIERGLKSLQHLERE
jgi:DNA repair protein RecO (recombination protein O)